MYFCSRVSTSKIVWMTNISILWNEQAILWEKNSPLNNNNKSDTLHSKKYSKRRVCPYHLLYERWKKICDRLMVGKCVLTKDLNDIEHMRKLLMRKSCINFPCANGKNKLNICIDLSVSRAHKWKEAVLIWTRLNSVDLVVIHAYTYACILDTRTHTTPIQIDSFVQIHAQRNQFGCIGSKTKNTKKTWNSQTFTSHHYDKCRRERPHTHAFDRANSSSKSRSTAVAHINAAPISIVFVCLCLCMWESVHMLLYEWWCWCWFECSCMWIHVV